jgi:F420-dependent oxidoreductase-like protein
LTLGVGPSHRPTIEGTYGLSYDKAGEHTEEYVTVLTTLLRGEAVDFDGHQLRAHAASPVAAAEIRVPVLLAALAPRMLRVAGEITDGTILWMGNEAAIEAHVRPRITAASSSAGRDAQPRIVAGLPVAVHDDVAVARRAAARIFEVYGQLPNYRRLLDLGGADGPEDAAIVGDEDAVAGRVEALFRAGATDVWAAIFPVGEDATASRRRTRALLQRLAVT